MSSLNYLCVSFATRCRVRSLRAVPSRRRHVLRKARHLHVHTCMYMRMYVVSAAMIEQHTKIFEFFVLIDTYMYIHIHVIEIVISYSIILWKLYSIWF